MRKTEKKLIITLKRDELVYDIDFITYKVAKVHFRDGLSEVAGEVATSESDKDYVDRLLMSGMERMKDELRWCVVSERANAASDRLCGCRKDYDLVLNTGEDWRGEASVVASLAHDYVVSDVVGNLLRQVAPDMAPLYEEQAQSRLNRLYGYMRTNQRIRMRLLF